MQYAFKIFGLSLVIFLTGCASVRPEQTNVEVTLNNAPVDDAEFLSAPSEVRVPILIYHQIRYIEPGDSAQARQFIVEPDNFSAQMKYLKENGFQGVTVGDLVKYLNGESKSWPSKPVVITFDDGMKNQYENAFPILRDNQFQATFFIFTNPIGKNERYFTWEQLTEMVESGMEVGGHGHYHLYLDKISATELEQEVTESKEVIEAKLNQPVISFAYPFGVKNEAIVEKIKTAGFLAGRGITNGNLHTQESLYSLKGYFITNDLNRFKSIVGF